MDLTITDVSKSYGSKCALSHFSHVFRPGVTAILGPNGAGKTTLMNLITDCTKRESGEIRFNGTDILRLKRDFRRRLGFMPQTQGMYEHMTAYAFLCYTGALKGMKNRAARQRAKLLLETFHLGDAAHRKVGGFSGGMRQRVMLAQALLADPDVLLLDEPTAGLDPEERVRLRTYIGDLSKSKIILITTHITSDVETVADEVVLMNRGRLLFASDRETFLAGCGAKDLETAYLRRLHA